MKITLPLLLILLSQCLASSAEASCKDAGTRLNRFATADQQIHQEWETLQQDARATDADKEAVQERMRSLDATNLKQLKEIIAVCGWPADKRGSHAAWQLVQHADSDIAFQKHARDLLEASVNAGIGAPNDLADLTDRIAANENRLKTAAGQ